MSGLGKYFKYSMEERKLDEDIRASRAKEKRKAKEGKMLLKSRVRRENISTFSECVSIAKSIESADFVGELDKDGKALTEEKAKSLTNLGKARIIWNLISDV